MWKKPAPVSVRAGNMEFLKVNVARWDWRDIYHWLLTLHWPAFGAVLLGIYVLVNLVFAGLFLAADGCVAGTMPGSASDAFFFSVETLATVGYGHMYPATTYGHSVATLEIMLGMFGMAVVTGLIFVRFSRPTARVVFSHTLVIAQLDGRPTLMMRVANLRHQSMVEAEFRMTLVRNERTVEGEEIRRFHALHLQVRHVILFPAALTIRHTIDEHSPLHGQTVEMLEASDTRVFASVVCVDTVIQAPVQSQHDYTWKEIHFGHRFVEIYNDIDANRFTVDYGRLHDTEPVLP